MNVRASKVIVVEDQLADAEAVLSGVRRGARLGATVPPPQAMSPQAALAEVTGAPGRPPRAWAGDELVLIDCFDRDAAVPEGPFRTTFTALDLLAGFRALQDAGATVPRIAVFSRGIADPMVRAALGEFSQPVRKVAIDRQGIRWGHRRDLRPEVAGTGILWAMLERADVEEHLLELAMGDRSASLSAPAATDPFWSELQPSSCLASFHRRLRDDHPDLWNARVLGRDPSYELRENEQKAVRRLGARYLEPSAARGAPTSYGYLNLAAQLADPTGPPRAPSPG